MVQWLQGLGGGERVVELNKGEGWCCCGGSGVSVGGGVHIRTRGGHGRIGRDVVGPENVVHPNAN